MRSASSPTPRNRPDFMLAYIPQTWPFDEHSVFHSSMILICKSQLSHLEGLVVHHLNLWLSTQHRADAMAVLNVDDDQNPRMWIPANHL